VELSVRKAAAECGDRIAVVLEEHALSYAELAAKVAGTCAVLTRRGLDSSTLVAICASNRGPTLIAVLAFIELGIPFVALHPRWTEREVAVVMSDANPRCLFGDAEVDSLMVGTSPLDRRCMRDSRRCPTGNSVFFWDQWHSQRRDPIAVGVCGKRARECGESGLFRGRSLAPVSTAVSHWRPVDRDPLSAGA
jgi:hypothetical protein